MQNPPKDKGYEKKNNSKADFWLKILGWQCMLVPQAEQLLPWQRPPETPPKNSKCLQAGANRSRAQQGPCPDLIFPTPFIPQPPSAGATFPLGPEMKIRNAWVISHCHTHWEGECGLSLAFPDHHGMAFASLILVWGSSWPPIGLKNIILALVLAFVPLMGACFPDLCLQLR